MTQQNITFALLGLVVVAGGVLYLVGSGNSEAPALPVSAEKSETVQEFRGSLLDLLAQAGAWQCQVSVTVDDITTVGSVYATDGKLRGDFVANVREVGNVQTHMIVRGNDAYTWTSLMNRGFKLPIENGAVQAPTAEASAASAFNQEYDYECREWTADESLFAFPSGIVF
jgi:hypothetical protein